MTLDELVHQLEDERWLDAVIAGCDWRFNLLSVLEARRNALNHVLALLSETAA